MEAERLPKKPWLTFFKFWRINRAIDYQAERLETDHRYQALKHDFQKLKEQMQVEELQQQLAIQSAHVALAESKHQLALIQRLNALELRAEALGMSLATYEEFKKAEFQVELELQKQAGLDDLKVKLQERLDKLEIDKEAEKMRIGIQWALAYKYLDFEALNVLVRRVLSAYEERYKIAFSGKPMSVINDQLNVMDLYISGLRSSIDGLLQGDNGEDQRRSLPDSFLRGIPSPPIAEGQA